MIQANSSLGKALDHRKYYRMPWTVTDNAMSWLEVTTKCNITCRGCYRDPRKDGHKSLDQIRQELEVFQDNRKSDGMSIAGGDPLVHPDIIEIVRLVRKAGYKPLVNTNGRALTPELLHKLRKAGASSFTFHVDTTQTRKDFPDTQSEETNNALRQKFADMLYREGGVTCGFNTTIHQQNLEEIPAMVRWAQENADRVHSFHFIPYRDFGIAKEFEIFAHGVRIDTEGGAGNPEYITPGPVTVQDVADQIRKADPAFAPSAYLGGNVDPKSLKWTFASRFVLKGKTLGYAGPRFMELTQQGKHLFTGTSSGMGKSAALYLADRGYRVFGGNLPGEEGATGSNISSAPLDIRSDESVERFMKKIPRPIDAHEGHKATKWRSKPERFVAGLSGQVRSMGPSGFSQKSNPVAGEFNRDRVRDSTPLSESGPRRRNDFYPRPSLLPPSSRFSIFYWKKRARTRLHIWKRAVLLSERAQYENVV